MFYAQDLEMLSSGQERDSFISGIKRQRQLETVQIINANESSTVALETAAAADCWTVTEHVGNKATLIADSPQIQHIVLMVEISR